MARSNEQLIRQVFKEMVPYRPVLEKFLALDELEEEVDFRILGDQIIKNYPWPVGIELRRLFSASIRELTRLRLDQIFKTIERTMQFVSFVMISQLWDDVSNKLIKVPENIGKEFNDRITVLSMGDYTWLIRTIGKLYSDAKTDWFVQEFANIFNKEFYSALDFWVPERNEIGHYQINLTQAGIEKRCVEYEEKLKYILTKIAFLAKYRFVSVRQIEVIKPKNRDAKYHHTIDLLNSSDSDFAATEIDEAKHSESHSVLLMKTIKSIEEYLNLSPLIINTHSEVLDTIEKFEIQKDIFMYSKFRNDHLMYSGTEVTEKCDLRALSNYQQLLYEFRELLSTISPTKTTVKV